MLKLTTNLIFFYCKCKNRFMILCQTELFSSPKYLNCKHYYFVFLILLIATFDSYHATSLTLIHRMPIFFPPYFYFHFLHYIMHSYPSIHHRIDSITSRRTLSPSGRGRLTHRSISPRRATSPRRAISPRSRSPGFADSTYSAVHSALQKRQLQIQVGVGVVLADGRISLLVSK